MPKSEAATPFLFVVQYHKTTRPHYDLRLRIGDVMPSWSVPKGPTLDPAFKRLAMQTTDHDLEYRNFEGVIPEGEYGAGPVLIWDEGTYIPEREVSKGVREVVDDPKDGMAAMKAGLEKGEIKFILHGKKLKGSFAMVKTRGFGPKNSWLLIKHKDEFCEPGYNASKQPKSARSGKAIGDIS